MALLPDPRFINFIGEHHILHLAVVRNNIPWCATCYYAYRKEVNRFIFTSDPDTRHIHDMAESGQYTVAGTIALETKIVGKIRGLQFSGRVRPLSGEEWQQARKTYFKRFPIARLMPELHLWELIPSAMKLTDNRLGFGTKLRWEADDVEMQD